MDYKTTEVSLVAYLRYWYDDKLITVDDSDLISAYVEDVGELRFPYTWLKDKAISRCKAWVRLLVDMNGIEKVEKEWISPYGRDLEYPPTYPPEER